MRSAGAGTCAFHRRRLAALSLSPHEQAGQAAQKAQLQPVRRRAQVPGAPNLLGSPPAAAQEFDLRAHAASAPTTFRDEFGTSGQLLV